MIAEIKKYIDKQSQKTKFSCYEELRATYYSVLADIEEMLDELEPKAKWTNNMNGTFTCSKCGAKRPNDNYCGNCGAKMEVEE